MRPQMSGEIPSIKNLFTRVIFVDEPYNEKVKIRVEGKIYGERKKKKKIIIPE
jgi:hypothetical protein